MNDTIIHTLINNRGGKGVPPSFEDAVSSLADKKIIIYGAGAFGKETFSDLQKNKIDIFAFLDKNARPGQTIGTTPVYLPDYESFIGSKKRKDMTIILAIVLTEPPRKEIISYLHDLGYRDIIDAQTLRAMRVPYSCEKREPEPDELFAERENILAALSLMADDHSRDIFTSSLKSHFSREYNHSRESFATTQYFDPGLPRKMKLSRFIDCGAYSGDTLETLARRGELKVYAGFEPGRKSYELLSQTADRLKGNIECSLFPCAVSDYSGTAKFNDIAGSGAMNGSGTEPIPVVRLDDALKNFAPTMVKMDIEGEEFHALKGAQKMIAHYKPDLAICVYHYISDYWRIPVLINSWDLGYEFYLRAHSSATMETVLYAISKGGS